MSWARGELYQLATPPPALRLGLRYVRGLREDAGQALVGERQRIPFKSIQDLARRVPELRKDELNTLAEIGALNSVGQMPIANCQLPIENPLPNQSAISNQQSTISKIDNRKSAIGNFLHRRDALWQVERAVRGSGPLLSIYPNLIRLPRFVP